MLINILGVSTLIVSVVKIVLVVKLLAYPNLLGKKGYVVVVVVKLLDNEKCLKFDTS